VGIPVRNWLGSAAAWLLGAIAAVVIGMQAVALLGDGLGAQDVRPLAGNAGPPVGRPPTDGSTADVALGPSGSESASTPAPSQPSVRLSSVSASPAPAPSAERIFSSPGGIVVVRCRDSRAYLVSWSPERGYRADDIRRGPAEVVSVKFVATRTEVELSVRCVGGVPSARVETDDEESDR
jgi:hypothetical protein